MIKIDIHIYLFLGLFFVYTRLKGVKGPNYYRFAFFSYLKHILYYGRCAECTE